MPEGRASPSPLLIKLHLFGASGTGVSTLGEARPAELGVPYFDTDAYSWVATDPPFTECGPPAGRDARLAHDLGQAPSWVVGGSIVGWYKKWLTAFDRVVFL